MKNPNQKPLDFIKVISVIIRVRNAAVDLRKCLMGLSEQIMPEGVKLEVVIVDNESIDGSAFLAQKFGAEIVTISRNEFTWGRAINRGIEKATGQIIFLLSADAYPADRHWITEMITPFKDTHVAAVYGRQLPRSDAPLDERVRLLKKFRPQSLRFEPGKCIADPTAQGMLVSNACAAIRKDIWKKIRYDEAVKAGEEGIWTYNALKAGYSYVYQASAKVFHSHNDPVFRLAWRELEIAQKNRTLKERKMGFFQFCCLIASFTKRRLKNCSLSDFPIKVRLKALLRMPFEMVTFCFVYLLSIFGLGQKFRALMWG